MRPGRSVEDAGQKQSGAAALGSEETGGKKRIHPSYRTAVLPSTASSNQLLHTEGTAAHNTFGWADCHCTTSGPEPQKKPSPQPNQQ
ncbi:uncharacterized protein JN550_000233 [Neoarthrinium moseri]|uniref:uncharacterized protein n=1 Tax=Neoarthrinium moseri TaxID=1658444 RepID=UPI001FDCAE4D|nr:uncharacterized protein JN550_000233 [Neoarthrinium moseri]KAI1878051.1 hypothetical protein JN550_000233 [Neoarthrinium moseri]